jgi:hypothetical protein
MTTHYPTDHAGKLRFQHDMLQIVNAFMRAGSTVGNRLWLWRTPRINNRLRGELRLSNDAIVYLGQAMRLILLGIGEDPKPISDAEYRQANTVVDLIGILWLSLDGGSQTWP